LHTHISPVCLLLHPELSVGLVLWDRPFITVWNAPTQECQEKYHVDLNLEVFDVVINRNESFRGREMTIFYSDLLGYYPHYTENGIAVNGGVPQNSSLKDHLWKAQQDIKTIISEPDFQGLAVVDWEKWRPLWIRDWDSMKIYRDKSEYLIQEQHPEWPPKKVAKKAKSKFEQSGRAFFEQTLVLGKTLRPGGFWGFYGFPNCYNYKFKDVGYTGECPQIEKKRNEVLQWLWNQSQALYPSIYLPEALKHTNLTLKFVHHRIQEAFRMVERAGNNNLPVLPYARIAYELTMDFLSQDDLIHTIGESAAQGASGIILWGNKDYSRTKESCLAVKKYVDSHLGHYIVNVTSSTSLCSQVLCSNHGRCVRRDSHPKAFLHLSPASFNIETIKKHCGESCSPLLEQMSKEELAKMAEEFRCRCYDGWEGTQCKRRTSWEE
uniref:Hyaluronidase n=1 Tax=Sphenodon punctatus TaxID=8508 RepID=A0A8D0G740_SPHPU